VRGQGLALKGAQVAAEDVCDIQDITRVTSHGCVTLSIHSHFNDAWSSLVP